MAIKLVKNWRQVLWGSWSSRLAIGASLLGCVELLLPLFSDFFPRYIFAGLSLLLAVLVPVARIIQQVALHKGKE